METKKLKRLNLKLCEADLAEWKAEAELAGLSLSEFIRRRTNLRPLTARKHRYAAQQALDRQRLMDEANPPPPGVICARGVVGCKQVAGGTCTAEPGDRPCPLPADLSAEEFAELLEYEAATPIDESKSPDAIRHARVQAEAAREWHAKGTTGAVAASLAPQPQPTVKTGVEGSVTPLPWRPNSIGSSGVQRHPEPEGVPAQTDGGMLID